MAGLTTALIVGGATVAAGAMGASAQSKAAGKASDAQLQASREATELQREQYYDTRNLMEPTAIAGARARAEQMLMQGFSPDEVRAFLQQTDAAWAGGAGGTPGVASMDELIARYPNEYEAWSSRRQSGGGLLGALTRGRNGTFQDYLTNGGFSLAPTPNANGSGQHDWVDDWSYESSSPSYAFRLGEGQRALERSAAARGRLFSGATGMALQRYGQDFASTEFENDFRRLGSLSGAGDNAQGITINAGSNYATQAGQNAMAAGNARASGYLASGNAQANFWGNTVPGALGAWAYGGKGWG